MKLIATLFLSCLLTCLMAQEAKMSIIVLGTNTNCEQAFVPDVVATLEQQLSNDDRFKPVSRESAALVESILEIQKGEIYLSAQNIVESVKATGAEYIIHVNATGCSAVERRDDNGKFIGYRGKVSMKITATDVASVSNLQVENYESSTFLTSVTREESILKAGASLKRKSLKFITKAFPLELKVVEMSKFNKGKAEEILIDGGSALGIQKNDWFELFEVEIYNGKPMESSLGFMKITEVKGQFFSSAKPRSKDAKTIFTAINERKNLKLVKSEGPMGNLKIPGIN